MSQDNKERTEKKNSQMTNIAIVSVLSAALFVIEIYEMINDPDNFIAIGALGVFLLGSIFTDLLLVSRLIDKKAQQQQEAFENIYRSEKAAYLLLRKYFDQMEQKMDSIGENNTLPFKELISAQKALAKAQINRNKQNTNALLISNDRMMQRISNIQNEIKKMKAADNSSADQQFSLNEQDKEVILEANRDVLQQQQEILNGLKEMEASLRNEIIESANKMSILKSGKHNAAGMQKMEDVFAPELQLTEDDAPDLQLPGQDNAPGLQLPGEDATNEFSMLLEDPIPELQLAEETSMPELQLTEEAPELQLTEEASIPELQLTEEEPMPELQLTEEASIPELQLSDEEMPELQLNNAEPSVYPGLQEGELPPELQLTEEESLSEFQLPEEDFVPESDFPADLQPIQQSSSEEQPIIEESASTLQLPEGMLDDLQPLDDNLMPAADMEENILPDVDFETQKEGLSDAQTIPLTSMSTEDQPISEEKLLADLPPMAEENILPDLSPMTEENELPDLPPIVEENEIPDLSPTAEENELSDLTPMTEGNGLPDLAPINEENGIPDLSSTADDHVLPDLTSISKDLQPNGEVHTHFETEQKKARPFSENSSESDLDKLLMQMKDQQLATAQSVLSPIQKEPELTPASNEPDLQAILNTTVAEQLSQQSQPEEQPIQPEFKEQPIQPQPEEPRLQPTQPEAKLAQTFERPGEVQRDTIQPDTVADSNIKVNQSLNSKVNEHEQESKQHVTSGSANESQEITPDRLAAMIANLGTDNMEMEPEAETVHEPVMAENLEPAIHSFGQNSMESSVNSVMTQKDSKPSADQELDDILKAMDIDDILGESVEDLDIDKILESPESLDGTKGSGDSQVMSSDEIAALIANTDLLSEPEPPKKMDISDLPDLSDPSHVMSSDEIAALLANM